MLVPIQLLLLADSEELPSVTTKRLASAFYIQSPRLLMNAKFSDNLTHLHHSYQQDFCLSTLGDDLLCSIVFSCRLPLIQILVPFQDRFQGGSTSLSFAELP